MRCCVSLLLFVAGAVAPVRSSECHSLSGNSNFKPSQTLPVVSKSFVKWEEGPWEAEMRLGRSLQLRELATWCAKSISHRHDCD